MTGEDFLADLYDKAREKGANPDLLIPRHAQALTDLSINAVSAFGGDERIRAHLEAQFKLGKFSLLADSFVEAHLWWDALAELLKQIATQAINVAAAAAAQALLGAMKGGSK